MSDQLKQYKELKKRAAQIFKCSGIQTITPAGRWLKLDKETFKLAEEKLSQSFQLKNLDYFTTMEASLLETELNSLYGSAAPRVQDELEAHSARLHLLIGTQPENNSQP